VFRCAALATSSLVAWSSLAAGAPEDCPRDDGPWVKVVFEGSAWSPSLEAAVLGELRVELGRRALQACAEPHANVTTPPSKIVTLLASDPGRVTVLPEELDEGGFVGRTVLVGSIPEDARALAIAQAVDEALRSAPSSPPARPTTKSVEPPPDRVAAPVRSGMHAGLALAPLLQIAPGAFSGGSGTSVAPGATLRLSAGFRSWGGSIGVSLTRASELELERLVVRQTRVPLDFSLRFQRRAGALVGSFELGAVTAWVDYVRSDAPVTQQGLEWGGRAGASVAWGHGVMPWLGVSMEVLPRAAELRLAPTGSFGRTPQVWLGLALGMEVRWP
jgi:hypothetical protein